MRNAVIALADGTLLRGEAAGAAGVATGEFVFNTSMTGYQEIVTDPSYAGQIVVMTAPHIGNYGATPEDEESDRPWATGLVVRAMSPVYSNWRAVGGFDGWLRDAGVVAITGVDTRRLTRHLRTRGAMPGAVGVDLSDSEVLAAAQAAPPMEGRDLASVVSTPQPYRRLPPSPPVARVVAYDFGMKRDIVSALTDRGFEVVVVPSGTSGEEALSLGPDGVFLSNGPGDPEPLAGPVEAVRSLLGNVPVFGICLGHQILGLALGAGTYKLGFGHHGANHPVRRLADGRAQITSQNHGFAVDLRPLATGAGAQANQPPDTVDSEFGEVAVTHVSLNDGTLEGLACREVPAFSVQFHPEAAPGPLDAMGLFDQFADSIERSTRAPA